MGAKTYKNQNIIPVTLTLERGVNYGRAGEVIDDNELMDGSNVIYDPNTSRLTTRPGTDCVLTAAATHAIRGLYYYIKDGSTAYLIVVSGSKLYYYTASALTEIGDIADASVKPAFLTFNGKLLIADGSSAIRTWDGSTYTTIPGSPAADCLATVRNRVVANHVSEPDSVYLSSPNDETGWTTTGTAVGLRAGYGDGLKVNGFAVLGDDVFVSKVGRTTDRQKKIYRLNVAASATSSWYLEPFSSHNAFTSKHTFANAYNNIFFADDNGFKTVKGIQEYGDLAVLPAGMKINKVFDDATCDFMAFVHTYDAIWFGMSSRIYCYTGFNDAFTELSFEWGPVSSVCDANGIVYLGGNNGYLYKISEDLDTDETAPGTTVDYDSFVQTKAFSSGNELILKKVRILFQPKTSSIVNLWGVKPDETMVLLGSGTLGAEGSYIYDATGYIYDATDYIGDTAAPEFFHSFSKMRAESISIKIHSLSGRFIVESVRAEFATVG